MASPVLTMAVSPTTAGEFCPYAVIEARVHSDFPVAASMRTVASPTHSREACAYTQVLFRPSGLLAAPLQALHPLGRRSAPSAYA